MLQINSGLNYLFDVPVSPTVQVTLVVVTTILATISVILGLDVGIKRLSEINITLAVILLLGILAIGPTVYLMQAFMQNTGAYLSDLVYKTFNLYTYNPKEWIGGWTIFWGWWLSWAPFVGLFVHESHAANDSRICDRRIDGPNTVYPVLDDRIWQ